MREYPKRKPEKSMFSTHQAFEVFPDACHDFLRQYICDGRKQILLQSSHWGWIPLLWNVNDHPLLPLTGKDLSSQDFRMSGRTVETLGAAKNSSEGISPSSAALLQLKVYTIIWHPFGGPFRIHIVTWNSNRNKRNFTGCYTIQDRGELLLGHVHLLISRPMPGFWEKICF